MDGRYHPFSEYASIREYITTLNPSAIIYSSRHCRSRIRQEPLINEEEKCYEYLSFTFQSTKNKKAVPMLERKSK